MDWKELASELMLSANVLYRSAQRLEDAGVNPRFGSGNSVQKTLRERARALQRRASALQDADSRAAEGVFITCTTSGYASFWEDGKLVFALPARRALRVLRTGWVDEDERPASTAWQLFELGGEIQELVTRATALGLNMTVEVKEE